MTNILDPVTNFAIAVIDAIDDSATTANLASGKGALFPAPATDGAFNVIIFNSTDYRSPSDDPNKEILRVTGRSTDALTFSRAQEGTSAATHNTSGKVYKIVLTPTKKQIDDIDAELTAIEKVVIPASASAPASLDLHEDTDNGTNKITIIAPSAVASDKVLTLPDETGTLISSAGKASGSDINTGTDDAKFATAKAIKDSIIFNAPQGFLLNGKIVPSVASNNLTVAIKGLDGNDPSATNPVYCRIGDTVRSITSALSVTKNAATNWFNAGSAELATQEIDYFVYLGYNATDGVVIGFARIPYGATYSSFSTTTTDERYAAISTISNAAATDCYEVVGRFAAILSAGAGYTWSVPTFDNYNLVQRPIYHTRSLVWTPTYSAAGSMTYTSITTYYANYQLENAKIHFTLRATGTVGGTPSTNIDVTAPFVNSKSVQAIHLAATLYDSAQIAGICQYDASFRKLIFYKDGSANWNAGASKYIILSASAILI